MTPVTQAIYQRLLDAIRTIGPFGEEVKKTSIHLVRNSAFAGVHPRKQGLILTVKADKAIGSPRVVKVEQVSKNRWHVDVRLSVPDDVDAELISWLKEAYALGA